MGNLTANVILVSSSSMTQKQGVFGKQFRQLQYDHGCIPKAPQLNLEKDIQMVRKMFDTIPFQMCHNFPVQVIQSSQHKKCFLSKDQIKNKIKEEVQKAKYQTLRFFFTGHGYQNGDMCIETTDNKKGERLTIQQILQIGCRCQQLQIYIDACFSAYNAERALKYIQKQNITRKVMVKCSSGKFKTSINTRLGGLLILNEFTRICGFKVDGNEQEMKKMFEERGPVILFDGKIYNYQWYKQQPIMTFTKRQQMRLFTNSKIVINSIQQLNICNFFGNQQIKKCKLLYLASENDFQVSKFHEKCDNIPHTLTLIKTESQMIIGGYTPIIWNKVFNKDATDPLKRSFIFSLSNNQKFSLNSNPSKHQHQIFCHPDCGPTFGINDIYLDNKSNQYADSIAFIGYTYIHPRQCIYT